MKEGLGKVICLGFFDGVHVGHARILEKGVEMAKKLRVPAVVLTFDRHPLSVITGESVPLLCGFHERMNLLSGFPGISEVIVLPFGIELAGMEWKDFFETVLVGRYNAAGLVCGFDYSFGAGGRGKAGELRSACAEQGIRCEVLPAVEIGGVKVSSSAIRSLISEGKVEEASAFLGRPVEIAGKIEEGRHIGRRLGFPTLNMRMVEEICVPRHGVYVTKTSYEGKFFPSITNIGLRPTITDGSTAVETHILGEFDETAYGKQAKIALLAFLRDEIRFDTPDSLRRQVEKDIGLAEKWFEQREGK